MSDPQKNLQLNTMRLKLRLSEMELSLQRADVRLLEMEDEKSKIIENKQATSKEIENLKNQIAGGN